MSDTPAPDEGLLFAIALLRFLSPSIPLGCVLGALIGKAFSRLFEALQQNAYTSVSTDEPPQTGRPGAPPTASAVQVAVDEHGITPVVVVERTRRSWLILLLFSVVAATFLFDGAVFVSRAVIDDEWESARPLWHFFEYYIVIGFLAFAIEAIVIAYQVMTARRGPADRWTPVLVALLASAGEVAMLGILATLYRDSFHGRVPLYPALHMAALVVRLAVLLFLNISFTPLLHRKTFRSNFQAAANGGTYGTFEASPGAKSQGPPAPPTKKEDAHAQSASLYEFAKRVKVLSPYLWPQKSFVLKCVALVCFLILVVGRIVNPLVPLFLGKIIEDLRVDRSPWYDLGVYIALRFMQGSGGILQVIRANLWIPVSQYSDREMSMMTFNHLLNLSLSFHTRRKTGEVLRVLDRGSAINGFFQLLIFQIAPIGFDIVIAIFVFALNFGFTLSLTVFLVMVSYVAASVILTQYRVKLRRAMNDKDKYCRSIHTDTLLNWETVKFFTAEGYEANRYRTAMQDYQGSEFQVVASLNLLNLVQNFIISIGLLIGSLIVAYSIVTHQIVPGKFVEWTAYLAQLYGPLNSLGTLYRAIQGNLVDTDNLMKLLAEDKEVTDKPDAFTLLKAEGEISFENVSFSYDGKVQALKDVSFHIPPGHSAAFVGESGSGKSTILRLLYRFYDIQSGSIKVDGHDLRDLTQVSLRRQIGVVPQDAVLFNESIKYNIGYGDPDAPQDRVAEAAKAAQIYDRIQTFPDQWETKVGERGVRLSGGEKQRVSIARTILKNPPILLLDEATSALDTSTEREIQHALRELAQGRTSLSIAHRLSTIVQSDIIFVVKDGQIVESGSHSALVAKQGIFADLWAKQIQAEVEGLPTAGEKKSLVPIPKADQAGTSGDVTPAHPH